MEKNIMDKLKVLENKFYEFHPLGFDSEEMILIEKKHKLEKFYIETHDYFSKEAFRSNDIIEHFAKVINASTLVSRFEKPAFKEFIKLINDGERSLLVNGLYEYLHGDEAIGFNIMLELLSQYKVAKWPILTVVKAYYNPQVDIFIKPTTVKKILKYFDVIHIKYSSKPTYDFYKSYRDYINDLKSKASEGVKPNNPAFSGFLMITIED